LYSKGIYMSVVINGTTGITNDGGYTGDGVVFADTTPANTLVTTTGGNVGIGTASPYAPNGKNLNLNDAGGTIARLTLSVSGAKSYSVNSTSDSALTVYDNTAGSERARIDSSGNLLVGRTSVSGFTTSSGLNLVPTDGIAIGKSTSVNWGSCIYMNRMAAVGDGALIEFAESGSVEGSISVSGTTVSYNGGHLSRCAQTTTAKDDTLVKGTVLSNLDEMNVYTDSEGNPVDNEQLNKVKVSDVEGDANVAGVFVNWSHDDAHDVDEINMAMTGDMIIRIAQGVTVQRGDLLMSAGDGTAKPQGDDIVRAKTVAKVTSTYVTCTYADGSFCVPCVLMAC
jgi:hypothetical protein